MDCSKDYLAYGVSPPIWLWTTPRLDMEKLILFPKEWLQNFPPSMYWMTRKITPIEGNSTRENADYVQEKKISGKRILSEADIKPLEKCVKIEHPLSPLKVMTEMEFRTTLAEASLTNDPFGLLTKQFNHLEEHWSCLIRLNSGIHLECQLAFDSWSSTAFGKEQPGEFRYIELYEHDPESGVTDEKPVISIRISQDYKEGEWLWINRGRDDNLKGKLVKGIALEISRRMKITKCFLADSATVPSSDGKRSIAIRIPLQIIFGEGFYASEFSLYETTKEEEPIISGVGVDEKTASFNYDQDVTTFKKELLWLQQLKVQTIYEKILTKKSQQREFAALIDRWASDANNPETKAHPLFERCHCTFQELMKTLYVQRLKDPQALADYEWVYFNLLDATQLPEKTKVQQKFLWIVDRLYFNMLMSANFDH